MDFKIPKHAFDSDDLAVLDQAYEATCAALQGHQGAAGMEELRGDLRRLLFRLAAQGLTDVYLLRDLALSSRTVVASTSVRRSGSEDFSDIPPALTHVRYRA